MLGPGRRILASQPFSVLLGAELLRLADGRAELRIPIRGELKQQHGFVHGGVISYAADNALTFAGGSVLGADVVTSEFKINYLRPAQGDSLVARAAAIHCGRTRPFVDATYLRRKRVLIACARPRKARSRSSQRLRWVPAEQTEGDHPRGWRVDCSAAPAKRRRVHSSSRSALASAGSRRTQPASSLRIIVFSKTTNS